MKRNSGASNLLLVIALSVLVLSLAAFIIGFSGGFGKKDSVKPTQSEERSSDPRDTEAANVETPVTPAADGMAPKGLSAKDIYGKDVNLSDFEGKVTIVDFWATTCPPCKAEFPDFVTLYNQYKDKGFNIIAVSVDRGGDAPVKKFIESNNVKFPVVMATEPIVNAYNAFGQMQYIPTTFIIDSKGKVVERIVGAKDKSYWESTIKKLLAERDGGAV